MDEPITVTREEWDNLFLDHDKEIKKLKTQVADLSTYIARLRGEELRDGL